MEPEGSLPCSEEPSQIQGPKVLCNISKQAVFTATIC